MTCCFCILSKKRHVVWGIIGYRLIKKWHVIFWQTTCCLDVKTTALTPVKWHIVFIVFSTKRRVVSRRLDFKKNNNNFEKILKQNSNFSIFMAILAVFGKISIFWHYWKIFINFMTLAFSTKLIILQNFINLVMLCEFT